MEKICQGLANASHLQSFSIKCNNIGDYGLELLAEAISHNNTLQHLDISLNQISSEGLSNLSKSIATTAIQSLNLSKNNLGNDAIIEFADYYFTSPSAYLEKIDVSSCRIGDTGLLYFLQ